MKPRRIAVAASAMTRPNSLTGFDTLTVADRDRGRLKLSGFRLFSDRDAMARMLKERTLRERLANG
jgi:hypothetical protein